MLGDALGSVGVIISGLVIKYCTGPLRFVVDPCCSLAIVLIIVRGTVSLRITGILLQQVPKAVDLPAARQALEGALMAWWTCTTCTCVSSRTRPWWARCKPSSRRAATFSAPRTR